MPCHAGLRSLERVSPISKGLYGVELDNLAGGGIDCGVLLC